MTEAERIEKELKDAVIGQEQLALDLVRALDLNKSLEDQIEYQNKSTKKDHDKISKLEFELKGATAENERLRQQLKESEDELNTEQHLVRVYKTQAKAAQERLGQVQAELKSAQELNRELLESLVYIAGTLGKLTLPQDEPEALAYYEALKAINKAQ